MPWYARGLVRSNGSPNGTLNGQIGDVAQDISGGTGLWVCANGGTVWAQVNTGGGGITALTGDVTATGPGSVAATLATSGVSAGSYGTATQTPTVTFDAKGRATAASNTSIAIAESQVTNLVSDLAAKAPLASPTFTGTTTAPEFSASGLTGATAASRYVGATASGSPASGTFAVGDFVADQTGAFWVCTVAGTPGTWVKTGGSGGSGIIATAQNTGSHTYTTNTAGINDVDAANMAVTFTAPASGKVVVHVEMIFQYSAGIIEFLLREATTTVAGPNNAGTSNYTRLNMSFVISGISAGSHTYKLAYNGASGQSGNILVGGAAGVNGDAFFSVASA